MDLMEQCRIWNENNEYQKIIDAIEALPQEELPPELASELARAYNNSADVNDRELFEKSIALLKPYEEYFQGEHNWNFRIAYAYYFLDQEGPALHYFEKALEARPNDGDTLEFIEDCRKRLSLPRFERPFRQRCAEGWASFLKGEADLRRLLDRKDRNAVTRELIAKCEELLAPAFADVSFELGFNGKKYELILTPEGDRAKLFELVYFRSHAPGEVLEHWNILVGRQPSQDFRLSLSGAGPAVSAEDVLIWVERADEGSRSNNVSLTLYCEKLLPLLRERESAAWWILSTLTDQIIGELPAMAYIDGFEVTDAPREQPGISLLKLPETLKAMGLEPCIDPEQFLENGYTAYQMEPGEDPEPDWRLDVFAGSTRCPVLVNEYLNGESSAMDTLHKDGAVPGFICYPTDCFANGEDMGKAVLDFRETLENALLEKAGPDSVTFLGGASGIHCGYLDFIAWDLDPVLSAAAEFFMDNLPAWANFHTFRRDVSTVRLKKEPEEAFTDMEDTEISIENIEADQNEKHNAGSFVGFVLLSDISWDKMQLIHDLKADWDVDANEDDSSQSHSGTLVFSVNDMMAAVSLMPSPVPDHEAEINAANNYMWPGAVDAAKTHKAHLMVAVLGSETPFTVKGRLFTMLTACCCRQPNATGVYASGTVFEPCFYRDFAEMIKDDGLPIYNWIWFGVCQNENGFNCYTYGMYLFGKDEMEILNVKNAQPGDVRSFLADMVYYVLENDVTLNAGETIGFSEDQKLPVTRSEGVFLSGMTLKIGYGSADG